MSNDLQSMLDQAFAQATKLYQERGFQRRVGFGKRPALISVDLANAWTRPGNPFTCEKIDEEIIPGMQRLLAAFTAATARLGEQLAPAAAERSVGTADDAQRLWRYYSTVWTALGIGVGQSWTEAHAQAASSYLAGAYDELQRAEKAA